MGAQGAGCIVPGCPNWREYPRFTEAGWTHSWYSFLRGDGVVCESFWTLCPLHSDRVLSGFRETLAYEGMSAVEG